MKKTVIAYVQDIERNSVCESIVRLFLPVSVPASKGELCIQADAGTGSSFNPATRPARLNAALGLTTNHGVRMSTEKTVLDTISAIATLATPVLLAILSAIGWALKNKVEASRAERDNQQARIRELEDKLREDRISTYNALLDPFFLLFTTEASLATDPKYKNKNKNEVAINRMLSFEYRQVGFKLSLVANDEVVRAYNSLMQFFYHIKDDQRPLEQKTSNWIALMANLLLEIRRSMGNQSSKLDRWEMIEWFMQDAHKMKVMHEQPNQRVQTQ